jgi:transposase-like protein
MGKYPSELKLKIVLEYLEGHSSYPRLCDKYNIPNVSTIYQWVHQYTSGKQLTTRSVKQVKDGRKTTQLERVEIVQWIIANDMDYSRAMNKYNVSYGQVYSWTRKFKQGGPEALVDRRGKGKTVHDQLTDNEKRDLEVKRLKARIEHLSTENAVLKKLQELERLDATYHTSTKQSKL